MEAKKFYIHGKNTNAIWIESIKYSLIRANNEYICAYRPTLQSDEKGVFFCEWSQGHYFEKLDNAIEYLTIKMTEYIADLNADIADTLDNIITLNKGVEI